MIWLYINLLKKIIFLLITKFRKIILINNFINENKHKKKKILNPK